MPAGEPKIIDAWVVDVAGEDGYVHGVYSSEEAAVVAIESPKLKGRERYVNAARVLTLGFVTQSPSVTEFPRPVTEFGTPDLSRP